MFKNLSRFFTALRFLGIKSHDLAFFQWVYPIILGVLCSLLFIIFPSEFTVFGEFGIVGTVNQLIVILIGFYIASLAAIASFQNEFLDKDMKGNPPPYIKTRVGDKVVTSNISRRAFLCSLFGYCAFVSIGIFLFGSVSKSLLPLYDQLTVPHAVQITFRSLWILIYTFFNSSLLVITLLGMHYLVDRMHRD